MVDTAVLVADVENLGHIAVLRSLGRAGFSVIACSQDKDALGFYSHYTHQTLIHPGYHNKQEYILWLNETLEKFDIKAIIPTESMMLAIKENFNDYAHLLPYPIPKDTIYNLFSKYYLFDFLINSESASDINKHLPKSYFLDSLMRDSELDGILQSLNYPLYAKTDAVHLVHPNESAKSLVKRLDTPLEAFDALQSICRLYKHVLLQEHVEGVGVGVFFLRWEGEIILYFMHQRLHEVPYTGGVSSYRKSFWHEKIYQDALNKLNALQYNGVIMFEYRWHEESDKFYLMEVNSRFWGSLHLALFAGVDFPKVLLLCMQNQYVKEVFKGLPYPLNIRSRETFPLEFQYVLSIFKEKNFSWLQKLKAIFEFIYLMLNPKVHSDLLFKKDNYLYYRSLIKFLSGSYQIIKKKYKKSHSLQ